MNHISNYFQIEWNMTVETIFLSILTQVEFHLVQNKNKNSHNNHVPFNLKKKQEIYFSESAPEIKSTRSEFCETKLKKKLWKKRRKNPTTPSGLINLQPKLHKEYLKKEKQSLSFEQSACISWDSLN